MWSLVSDIEGEAQAEGFRELGPEDLFVPKSENVTEEWRRLHNTELDGLYS